MTTETDVILQLAGLPTGGSTPFDGMYLAAFDHEAFDGRGDLQPTANPANAKRFPSATAALEFIHAVPACRPLRPDGKPNRPLTATNWTIVPAPKES